MRSAIYIPTNRPPLILGAVLEAQRALNSCSYAVPIHVVFEPQYYGEVARELRGTGARPLVLPRDDMGIGYSRNQAVTNAERKGYETIIMMDDDKKFSGNIPEWLGIARRKDIVVVGSFQTIYGLWYPDTLMVQAAKARQSLTFLHGGSAGNQVFALNVANTMALGNFNASLRAFEDQELCRQAMKQFGLPWYIHTGILAADRVPRSQQYKMIGNTDSPSRIAGHEAVAQLWPEFISQPPKRHVCRWKKLAQTYLDVRSYPLEDISTSRPYDWRP